MVKNVCNAVWSTITSRKAAVGIGAGVVAVVGLLCFFLIDSKADKLAAALPEDATVIARLDAEKLLKGNKMLAELVEENLSKEDLKETGVDFGAPAYAFAYQKYFGCVVSLREEDDFLKFITHDGEIENQRGLKWGTTSDNFLVATDGSRAMIVGPATSRQQDELRNDVCEWLGQKKCKVNKDVMKAVNDGNGFLTFAGSYANLPGWVKDKFEEEVLEETGMKGLMSMEDMLIFADLSFTDDELALDLGVNGLDEDLLAAADILKPISGTLAGTFGNRPFFHAEMAVNGEDVMRKVRMVINMIPGGSREWSKLNDIIGVERIVESINGDISVTMPKMPDLSDSYYYHSQEVPGVLVQAEVEDGAFMDDAELWGNNWIRFNNYKDNIYQVDIDGGNAFYFGTDRDRLLFSTQEQLLEKDPRGKRFLPKEAKGSLGYVCINLEELKGWERMFESIEDKSGLPEKLNYFKDFSRLMFVIKDKTHVRVSLGKWK